MKKLIFFILILASLGLVGYYFYDAWWKDDNGEPLVTMSEAVNDAKQIKNEVLDVNVDTKAGNGWSFIVVGDNEGVNNVSKKIIEDANASGADLLVNVGDFTERGQAGQFEEMVALYKILEIPWYGVIGNNDMGYVKTYDDTNYRKYINDELYYSFDHKNAHFIILDNANRNIGFDDEQLTWLENDLSKNNQDYTFVFFHKPFKIPFEEFFGDDETPLSRKSNEALLDILNQYKIDQVYTGHVHTYLSYNIDELPVIITGGGGAEPQELLGSNSFYHYIETTVGPGGMDNSVIELE
ncbi:metallophosphoesterase [Patescibacteria group bacterium]|nr:metallophosphoesterase [Patescibacteria group bacterium]MBU1673618.1 metallophosphoesterase [Patescibacteria group bacterium]MBU1963894.1 metallophosphoesterase [Patescibacteria group bacterium]